MGTTGFILLKNKEGKVIKKIGILSMLVLFVCLGVGQVGAYTQGQKVTLPIAGLNKCVVNGVTYYSNHCGMVTSISTSQ